MSPTSPAQTLAAEATHVRILRAATVAFAERGYVTSSVEQLLDCLQLDLPTFESHFNDTEDCFLQAYDRIVAEAAARTVASLPSEAAWPKRLAVGLSTLLELVDADRPAARLVLVEAQDAFPTALARHTPMLDRLALFMRQGRDLSSADSQIPGLIDSALPAGVASMLTARLRERPRDPVADLFPDALRYLLLPYLGDPETTDFIATAPMPESVVVPSETSER
jgi:AcrR family transcriptional regulator